jgi:hypothetical protein
MILDSNRLRNKKKKFLPRVSCISPPAVGIIKYLCVCLVFGAILYVCRPNPSSKYLASCLACSIRAVCVFMVHKHVDRLRKLLRQSESKCADVKAKLAEYVAAGEAKLVEYLVAGEAKLVEYVAAGEAKLASEAKRVDAEAKLAEREAKLAEREAKVLEGGRVIAGLQDNKEVSLQEILKQSMLETNMGKLARQACEEDITLLIN